MPQKHTLILVDESLNPAHPAVNTLACVLGPGKVAQINSAMRLALFDRIVLCAVPEAGQKMINFVQANAGQFTGRPVALVSLEKNQASAAWPGEVARILGSLVTHTLTVQSGEDTQKLIGLALEFRAADHTPSNEMPAPDLKKLVEAFLLEHNTLTLTTHFNGRVRATPMEYRYRGDGVIYCVSEGGEKFAGLLGNGQVALAIYDPYRGFERLSGMQMTGTARVPAFGSPEHLQVLSSWGLTMEKVNNLPSLLHGIVITLDEVLLMSSGLIRLGWRPRQTFRFPPQAKTAR